MTTRKKSGAKSTFRELLLDTMKKMDMSENELAQLLRDMLLTHGISPSQWDQMADRYYRRLNTNSKGEVDLLKVQHDKSNMAKALARDTIPWRRFVSAVQILGPINYKFTVELEFPKELKYRHEVLVRNRYADQGPIDDDEDDNDDE